MLKNKSVKEINVILNDAYSDKQNSEILKDSIQEYYNYGHCMDLAIAFHRLYGFHIEAAIVDDISDCWIGHSWVKMPNGLYFDIMGTYKEKSELESFGNRTLVNLNEKEFSKYILNKSISDIELDINKAMTVAKFIFEKLHKNN